METAWMRNFCNGNKLEDTSDPPGPIPVALASLQVAAFFLLGIRRKPLDALADEPPSLLRNVSHPRPLTRRYALLAVYVAIIVIGMFSLVSAAAFYYMTRRTPLWECEPVS